MKRVVSRVYFNQDICFNNGTVQFRNGVADISDEIFDEIVERKFPNIFEEGKAPEYRTKFEEKLIDETNESNQELLNEIQRLKNIIESQKIELIKKDDEIKSWKKAVEDLNSKKEDIDSEGKEGQEIKITESDQKELIEDLRNMKKEELIETAKSEVGGSFNDEDIKGKTKEEIINLILSKI